MSLINEDSDMKIVGSSHFTKEDGFDVIQFVEEAKLHRFNGNSAKAKALGANIVSAFSYRSATDDLTALAEEYGVELTETVLWQVKILSVFSAEYCIDTFLPSAMLSTVAVGELYDVLQEVSPELYDELSKSTAFSFYYLCLGDGNENERIGTQFAASCGQKDNEKLASFGAALHKINTEVFRKAINGLSFV